jgi:hypothetical protein
VGKVTILLSTEISLKVAELKILIFDTKICFALLASLRSAILLKWTTNWSLNPRGLTLPNKKQTSAFLKT